MDQMDYVDPIRRERGRMAGGGKRVASNSQKDAKKSKKARKPSKGTKVTEEKKDESATNSESKGIEDTDSKSVGDRDSGLKAIDIVKDVITNGLGNLSVRSKTDANNDEMEVDVNTDTNEYTSNFHSFRDTGTIKPVVDTLSTPPSTDKISATIEVVDRFNNTLSVDWKGVSTIFSTEAPRGMRPTVGTFTITEEPSLPVTPRPPTTRLP